MKNLTTGLTAIVALLSSAAMAQSGPASSDAPIKSREQIRCELLDDCVAPPATRAWITETGAVEVDRSRVGKPRKPKFAAIKPVPKAGAVAKKARALEITPVKSSDLFINFESGSAFINDAASAQAAELFQALSPQEWTARRFIIAGHTDAVGSERLNSKLSRERANAVVELLVARGVNRSQLEVKGMGFTQPIEGLDRTDGRNRRVEIILAK
jgi:outer membrane protein OmpA-like peptidoglycan-associated protein